jgi:hypothetical protein
MVMGGRVVKPGIDNHLGAIRIPKLSAGLCRGFVRGMELPGWKSRSKTGRDRTLGPKRNCAAQTQPFCGRFVRTALSVQAELLSRDRSNPSFARDHVITGPLPPPRSQWPTYRFSAGGDAPGRGVGALQRTKAGTLRTIARIRAILTGSGVTAARRRAPTGQRTIVAKFVTE